MEEIKTLEKLYNENIEKWNWNQKMINKGIDVGFYVKCNETIQKENFALLVGIQAIKKTRISKIKAVLQHG